jgi:hypothetical protein
MKLRRHKYLERYGELSDYRCAAPQREILIVKGFVMYWKYLNIQYEVQSFNQAFLKGQIISSQVRQD